MRVMQGAMVAERPQAAGLGRIHGLLAVQSLVVILVSVNRLSNLTAGYVLPNEFLRWVDLNNMLLALVSVVAFHFLKQYLESGAGARDGMAHRVLALAFIVGVYVLAVSYGNHEVTNHLHIRFCPEGEASALCRVVIFNDDEFSHWLFFGGFVLVNVSLMLLQLVFPHRGPLAARDMALLALNSLFIGAGIFANLAFEVIGLDLYVVALLAVVSLALLWRRGAQPLLVYYSLAYGLGLAATALYLAR